MKALLAKFSRQRAIGLLIDDQEITLSEVAATPLGPVELTRRREAYEPEQLGEVLKRLLASWLDRRQRCRLPVVVGLPTLRVFFSTRPIRNANSDATPQTLLHEVLQSPTISIDEMAVESIRSQPGKRPLASIVSCRKKYLSGLLVALKESGVEFPRVEPTPCALLRSAILQYRLPRRAKVVLRIFVGREHGFAVVAAGDLPVVWRFLDLPPGEEPTAIRAVVRALQAVLKHCGIDSALDAVLIHGRGPWRDLLETKEFQADLGMPVICHDDPTLDQTSIAYGLALGGISQSGENFDLARTLKPPPAFRDIFPWGELTVHIAILLCMGFFLFARSQNLHAEHQAVASENARRDWSKSVPTAQLDKEMKDLTQKVEAIQRFLDTRIVWSAYTHDVSLRLPATVSLSSLQGQCELESGEKKSNTVKPKKSFILRAAVPMAQNGLMPQEIDGFMGTLREHPLLKRDFHVVELADIKSTEASAGMKSMASFTVLCLPKVEKPGSSGKGEKKGKKQAEKS